MFKQDKSVRKDLTLPTLCISESCIKIKINTSSINTFTLLCGASKRFMKVFKTFIKAFEAPQRSNKTKSLVNFFCSSGIETVRVNISGNGSMQ